MKIVTNEKLIKRNSRIGQIGQLAGLIILAGGLIISIRYQSYFYLSVISLILGFTLSQIGISFSNRYGRHPRPDELLDQGLKGLNDQYSIYHYATPAAHLLVGPAGLWVIMPYHQGGKIVYEKKRWRQIGGGFTRWFLRLFGQDGLGRPDLDSSSEVDALEKYFKKNIPEVQLTHLNVVIVFINSHAELEVDQAPILTLPVKELKNSIRKNAKTNPLPPDTIRQINELFA